MTTRQRYGLRSRGNRVLLGVVVGWLGWLIANSAGLPTAAQLVILVVVGATTYAVLTAAQTR